MMVRKLKFLVSLCVLMLFTSGCMSFGAWGMGPLRIFRMNNTTYFTRSGAKEAHKKHLKEILAKTNKVSEPLAEKCILVIPTYWWLRNSCVWGFGGGTTPVGCLAAVLNKEESIDYVVSVMQRGLDTIHAMVKKSGLFKECEIVSAKDGNGKNEYSSTGNAFVLRVWSESNANCPFHLLSPDGKSHEVIDFDLVADAHSGWKKLTGKIKKLTVN